MRWLNLAAIGGMLLCYLAAYVNPARYWQSAFVALSYPYLLLLHAGFMLFWVVTKNYKNILFSFLCLLLGWSHLNSLFAFRWANQEVPSSKPTYTVLTYNVGTIKWGKGDVSLRANDFLARQNADFLLLQEVPTVENYLLSKVPFLQQYPFFYQATSDGKVIFSKFPIGDHGCLRSENSSNGSTFADIELPEKKIIRLYNVHLQSNSVSGSLQKLGNEQENSEQLKQKARGILAQIRHTYPMRVEQAEQLCQHARQSPNWVVLGGDFNDTPQSYIYRMLGENRCDAWQVAGMGWGVTYRERPPFLHIDHILMHPKFEIFSCKILDEAHLSDHNPVVSCFSF